MLLQEKTKQNTTKREAEESDCQAFGNHSSFGFAYILGTRFC